MPLFEYTCENCRKDFTLLQSAHVNKDETTCPECGTGNVRHKFSTFASNIDRPLSSQKPVTLDDFPNKDIFKLPPPRHVSEL